MSNKRYLKAVLLLCVAACTSNAPSTHDSKSRLSDYIAKTFAIRSVEDKAVLITYLSGDAKSRLSAWSDEQFREAFIDRKRKFVRLYIADFKTISPTENSITYELTYEDSSAGKETKVTQKKVAQLVNEGGAWYIKEVRSVKELLEYQNEMSLP